MNNNIVLQNIVRFIVLMLLQVLVLNNVYLGQFINPFLYVLFILMLPTNLQPLWMLIIAFCTGLGVDVAANMLGFHAASATLVAFCRILFANKILTRGEDVVIDTPCIYTVATQTFLLYLFIMLLIYNTFYFLIEAFSFQGWWRLLLASLISTLITWLLALIYQVLFLRRMKVK